MERIDVLIAGAGPAGCAAAVQCARLGLSVLVAERAGVAGGLIRNARLVENLPLLEEPLPGRVLAGRLGGWLEREGIPLLRARVESIAPRGDGWEAETSAGRLSARAVVAATGTRPVKLGVPGENEAEAGGFLFYEPVEAEELSLRGKRVAVVGGGEAAFDYALGLADKGAEVTILVRSRPRARGALAREVRRRSIEVVTAFPISSVLTTRKGLVLGSPAEKRAADLAFVAVGREPLLPEMPGRPALRPGCNMEPAPGLFVVGDARLGRLGHLGSALGDGLSAAWRIAELLEKDKRSER